jgi:F420H(2)-dependent biliverdin reductase
MALTPAQLDGDAHAFLASRRLASLTTFRSDGSAHVVPVGFMYDPAEALARIVAPLDTVKVANLRRDPRAVLCQVDGGLWATLEGVATIRDDDASFARTLQEYEAKFGPMHGSPHGRCSVEIAVQLVMGRFAIPGGGR